MSEIRIVRDYPYPVATVWRALTDPDLIPLWTSTGAGRAPGGLRAEVPAPSSGSSASRSRLERHRLLRGPRGPRADAAPLHLDRRRRPTAETEVTYHLASPAGDGTRFTYEHTGFTGVGGLFMAQMLGRVRRKMLGDGPARRPSRPRRRRPATPGKHAAGQVLRLAGGTQRTRQRSSPLKSGPCARPFNCHSPPDAVRDGRKRRDVVAGDRGRGDERLDAGTIGPDW